MGSMYAKCAIRAHILSRIRLKSLSWNFLLIVLIRSKVVSLERRHIQNVCQNVLKSLYQAIPEGIMSFNKFCIIVLLCSLPASYGIHPYMTCEGCETFVECFFKCPRVSYPGINRDGIYVNNYHQNVNDPKVVASSARAETGLQPQSWISYLFNKIMRRRSQKIQRPSRYRRRRKLHKYANYVPYSPYRHPNHYMKKDY